MKVGIVGCGTIAAFHLSHIIKHKSVESVSIADIDRQKSEAIAKQFKVDNIYQDFEALLKEQQPDVVHILTPPSTHAKLAIQAMELGSHVLVEKPMALSVEETDVMIAAASKNAVKLCIDHNFLFDPNVMKAWELVQTGKAGRVLHIEACYSFDVNRIPGFDPNSQNSWHLRLPGGILLDSVAHPLSILLRFLSNPLQIWAVKKSSGTLPENLPDELRVLIDTDEATGTLSVSLGTRPDCFTVNIYATEMSIHVNLSNMMIVTRKNRQIPKKIFRSLDNIDQSMQLFFGTFSNAFKVLTGQVQPPGDIGPVITRFYQSLENDSELPVTGEDGRAVVKLINEIWKQVT